MYNSIPTMSQIDVEDEERLAQRVIRDSSDPTQLTVREQVFADRILAGDTQKQAAMTAYGRTEEKAQSKATNVMHRDRVIAYLERQSRAAARRIIELSKTAKNETVRLNANQDILDRSGIGGKDGSHVNIAVISLKDLLK